MGARRMRSKDRLPNTTRLALVMAALMTTTAGTAVLLPAPALAQQAPSETRSFDIPAQPLPDALVLFGRQAGLEVSAESANTRGRTTQGVTGDLSPAEALSRLLTGTGLTFRWISGGAVMIEPSPQTAGGAVTLGPVRVEGEGTGHGGGAERPPVDTRGTYTVRATNSATKLDLAIKDTPQVVNVITRQRIEDQNLTQVADVIAQAPGITVQQQGVPGSGRIQYFSRGFPVTNVMLDGVVTTGAANRDFDLWSALDTAIYDRVELVQGSTGLATGAGDPSGSVNFVRKRPTEELFAEAKASYGSWDRWRLEGDISAPLDEIGTLRARVVGAHQQGDTWQDRVETKSSTLYGIVEADATDDLLLTAGLLWTNIGVDGAAPFGISPGRPNYQEDEPYLTANLGRNFNPATHWTFTELELLNPFAKVEWRLGTDWRLNLNYMFSKISHERLYGSIGQSFYSPERDIASYDHGHVNVDGEIHNVDAAISGKFHLLGREHDIVAGFSGYWGKADNPIYRLLGGGPTEIAISAWNNGDIPMPTFGFPEIAPGIPFPLNDLLGVPWARSKLNEKQYGGYIGTRLRPMEGVSLVLGGRLNYWERSARTQVMDSNQLFAPPYQVVLVPDAAFNQDYTIKGKFSPYAGILFDLTRQITLYASYARIEKANIDYEHGDWYLDVNGDPIAPIRGDTIEIGAKAALFDGRLNVQLTGYRMKQKNFPVGVPIEGTGLNPGCPFPNPFNPLVCAGPSRPGDGGYISEGVDFSLSGQVSSRINLSASYSYLEQEFDFIGTEYELIYGRRKPTCYGDNNRFDYTNGIGFSCPKHVIKVFGTYQADDDLTVGGGVVWKSATQGSSTTASGAIVFDEALNQPSYAVVDLMVRYRITPRVTLSANLYNLFDKKYLTASARNAGYWGAPRNAMISVGFKY